MTQGFSLPKKYKKEQEHSYALGPFPTFELLAHRPEAARAVYYREEFREQEKLLAQCAQLGIPCYCSDRGLERISQKEICYAAGEFEKYLSPLAQGSPHVALVCPGDMGNLGTILRTMLGFGLKNLAIIGTAADVWNPKVIRASMGAIFSMQVDFFPDFPAYEKAFGENRAFYPFLLEGGQVLTPESCPKTPCYTLIFGNEATGLPPSFQKVGQPLFIPQSPAVDSLNLAVSVAVGAYLFTWKNPMGES